jgi:hypothetical protein
MRSNENFFWNEANKSHNSNVRANFRCFGKKVKVGQKKMVGKPNCVDLVNRTGMCGGPQPATRTDTELFVFLETVTVTPACMRSRPRLPRDSDGRWRGLEYSTVPSRQGALYMRVEDCSIRGISSISLGVHALKPYVKSTVKMNQSLLSTQTAGSSPATPSPATPTAIISAMRSEGLTRVLCWSGEWPSDQSIHSE